MPVLFISKKFRVKRWKGKVTNRLRKSGAANGLEDPKGEGRRLMEPQCQGAGQAVHVHTEEVQGGCRLRVERLWTRCSGLW